MFLALLIPLFYPLKSPPEKSGGLVGSGCSHGMDYCLFRRSSIRIPASAEEKHTLGFRAVVCKRFVQVGRGFPELKHEQAVVSLIRVPAGVVSRATGSRNFGFFFRPVRSCFMIRYRRIVRCFFLQMLRLQPGIAIWFF